MRGAAVDREPRAFKFIREYASSYTSAAGPKSFPYAFCGILVGSEEL